MAQDLETLRHSVSHVLAAAVKELFPEVKLGIGPAIEDGFYYDFDRDTPFTPEDLKLIQKKMRDIIKKNQKFEHYELDYKEAKKQLKDEPYKLELLEELKDKGEKISFYKNGSFVDLCSGPHLESTGEIKAYKLLKIAAAYWRGNSDNKQLQRIYGTAFFSKEELKEYLKLREEAERRDHRKIGKKLQLFSFHEEAPGMVFFLPKGMIIWNKLIDYWRKEHENAGYVEIKTPIMMNRALWEKSGHWDNYQENMYLTEIDNVEYAIKPMNCPGGMLVYKERTHSYREFPLKMGEIGLVHRHELSGVLSGLFRVRSFHQDDAHIFMTEDQITEQVLEVLNLAERFYSKFGLDYTLELSTRPEKSIGTDEQWEKATQGLKEALDKKAKPYTVNEGDGAFYGPKIDLHIKDALGRTWQCGTVQLDMSFPERFDLTYEGEDGKKHRPVMIHRVIYGSMERFMGVLTEHYAGRFPLWLSPVQVRVLPIADRHADFGKLVVDQLENAGFRAELDDRAESTNKKVRNAQVEQVNYILVIGDNEVENKTVNIRTRDNKVHGEKKVETFIEELKKKLDE